MKKICIRNKFISLMTALLLLVGGICPVLAEEAKATAETKAPAAVPAVEEEKPTAQMDVSTLTKYVWRGQEMTRDSIVIQPSLTVGYKGFSANLWANLDTNPYAPPGKSYASTWTETDLTFAYNKTFGPVTAGMGYIYYGLGSANKDATKPPDAQEVFATITLNKLLSPTLTVYREVDHYRQWYALFAISHTLELNKMVSLKLAASASYLKGEYADATLFNAAGGYGGYPKFNTQAQATNDKFDNFHDGVVTVSLPIAAAKYITITPTISYVFPLSDDAKYEMQGRGIKSVANNTDRDSSFLYGGLTLSLSF